MKLKRGQCITLTDKKHTSTSNHHLRRLLGKLDVFSIASGAMISSGLFILPGIVFDKVGPVVILAYIFAGIMVLPAIFSKAELTTAMPKAGGSYFFIERSLGSVVGTIGGFASWISLSLKSAFALVGIGAFTILIFPEITQTEIKIIASGFCIFFTIINIISVKTTGKIQIFLVIGIIVLLSIYIIKGAFSIDIHRYTPFFKEGIKIHDFIGVIGMVFISFGGVTKISSIAEEIKNPSKTVPFGMIVSFLVVIFLYALTIFITIGIIDASELANSLTPISQGGSVTFGFVGMLFMSLAAILAFVSTGNAGILAASRFLMSMSRDQLLPEIFSKVNIKFKTPHLPIILTGAFMLAVILLLDLQDLVKVASTMMIVLFILVILSCIIMRESKIMNYKPTFKSPFYPWIHVVGIVAYGFLLFEMGLIALISTGGFVLVSIIWNKIYFHRKAFRKSALIHVVERIASKEIAGDSLGAELRDILKDRDGIIEDKFDKLVKNSPILDLNKAYSLHDFFELIAEKLSAKLNLNKEILLELFVEREEESTTVLRPGLAIPHITIPGKNKFEIIIVRCDAGITFSEDLPPVYAVFVIIGSKDERLFHLKALAAIAQITQDANFDKAWLGAKNIEDLKDIIVLSKRRRQ